MHRFALTAVVLPLALWACGSDSSSDPVDPGANAGYNGDNAGADNGGGDNGGGGNGGGGPPAVVGNPIGAFELPFYPPASFSGDALIPAAGDMVLRDVETGTIWNLRGEAISGPLAAEKARLRQLPSYTAFWFAWSVFNHDTEIWTTTGVETQSIAPIDSTGACGVPCNEIVGGGPPKDGIPSVDHDDIVGQLTMVSADGVGTDYLRDDDLVVGVVLHRADGTTEARAYSHNLLWWHEIANDTFEGQKLTVTLCPLTGSSIVFAGGGEGLSFGTSGKLFNSNLVMYDRVTDSQWSQMLGRGVTGSERDQLLELLPMVETTWAQWRALYPETLISSDETGHRRDYQAYPYVRRGTDYRENHNDTFRPTRPSMDGRYFAKDMVVGIRTLNVTRAYPYKELDAEGERAVVNDTVDELPLALAWFGSERYGVPFDRRVGEQTLSFEAAQFDPATMPTQ